MHALINNVTYLLPSQPLSFSHSELIGRHMTDSSPRYFPPGPGMVPPMAERTVNFLVFKNDAPNLACMLIRLLSAFFSLFFLGAASGTSFAEVTVPDALKDRIALTAYARTTPGLTSAGAGRQRDGGNVFLLAWRPAR